MTYEGFLIAGFKSGVELDKAAWLLPQDAFQEMHNAYLEHGVIKKRQGMQFFASMVHHHTTITGISNANPGVVSVASMAGLTAGTKIQISYAVGGTFGTLNGGVFVVTNPNVPALTFELYTEAGVAVDTTAFGAFVSGVVCIFPELPIMGIKQFVSSQTTKDTLVWDTRRMAVYNGVTNALDPIDLVDIFTGDNTNFINTAEFGVTPGFATPTLFFSNYNGEVGGAIDVMRTWIAGSITSTAFRPQTNTAGVGAFVETAKHLYANKDRLLLIGTVETFNGGANTFFPQRARWSTLNNPSETTPNWDDIIPGNGGFRDASTSDVIIGAEPIQESVIANFSDSTWSLYPTSDPASPFKWNKINNFRSSDASQAQVAFDQFVTSFGQRGIFATDGNRAQRIDEKIPDFVVENVNLDAIEKTYSERDYVRRKTWTLYPSANIAVLGTEQTTSDRALIRTDDDGSFSTFSTTIADDSGILQNFSCLGYGNTSADYTFGDFDGITLPEKTWGDFADEDFLSYFTQGEAELFLGGDQIGRVFRLEVGGSDEGADIEMNLLSAGWNPYREQGVLARFGYMDIYVDSDYSAKLTFEFFKDDGQTPYKTESTFLLPKIGFLADISGITQANPAVVSAYQHGMVTGQIGYIYTLNGIEELTGGPYTITVIDSDSFSLDGVDATGYSAYVSGGKFCENPFVSTKCWKRVFAGGTGYKHTVKMTTTGQGQTVNIDAFMPYFRPTGTRVTS